jgi:hypothetical protein
VEPVNEETQVQEPFRIPSPADWDLSPGDLALFLAPHRGRGRVTALIKEFFITEKTAQVWLEHLNHWQKQQAS